jgi:hypothetical protein
VEGFWPIFFLLVVLKIPVFGALWLVWWASRPMPETDGATDDSDGGFKRWKPEPNLPRGPRRDPHGGIRSGVRRDRSAHPEPRHPARSSPHAQRTLADRR